MKLQVLLEKIQDVCYTDEELGRLAAMILNETNLSLPIFENFWKELNPENKGELQSRLYDMDVE